MNYTGPKAKRSRRLGVAITPKSAKFLERRAYAPGQHGKTRRPNKLTDFGRQMLEKQRLRYQYNISERQLRNAYARALQSQEATPEVLAQLLETRLDSIVLRAGFARTIHAARQYVGHGHILVNGKKVDVPSYHVEVNDVISVKDKSKGMDCFKTALSTTQRVAYVTTDENALTAKLNYVPKRDEIPVQCDIPTVVEFYSR